MKPLALRFAPLALAVLLFGCAQAPPPAPPDTRAADEKAIRDTETAWVKEFAAKDMDKIVAPLRRRCDRSCWPTRPP